MRDDLKELSEALRFNMKEAMMSPVIVTTVVAAASWLATTNLRTSLTAGLAGATATAAIEAVPKVLELFRSRRDFSDRQRQIMVKHPMAFLLELKRQR